MYCYKKYDKTHHKQYLLTANFTINEFFLFSNAFTANKLRATAARFTCFVSPAFTLAVLLFVAFLHTAVGDTRLMLVSFSFFNKPERSSSEQTLMEALE